MAVAQTAIDAANVLCTAAVLYFAVRAFVAISYPISLFVKTFTDTAAGVIHVPGGWGLLEYFSMEVIKDRATLTGVLLFRGAYYILPLIVAATIFVLDDSHALLRKPALEKAKPRSTP